MCSCYYHRNQLENDHIEKFSIQFSGDDMVNQIMDKYGVPDSW